MSERQYRAVKLAGLACIEYRPAQLIQEAPVIIAMHGYGANERDLAPLAEYVAPQCRWVFPQGPLAIDGLYEGRAWFHLRVEEFMLHAQRGDWAALMNLKFPALDHAATLIRDLVVAAKFDAHAVCLAGFSQGAMLALHTAIMYSANISLSGLMLWSPSIVEWPRWSHALTGLPQIFMSHGMQDSVLPFAITKTLHEALIKAHVKVQFETFRGEHEIPSSVVNASRDFIAAISGQPNATTREQVQL